MAQAPNPVNLAAVEAALAQQGAPPPVVPAAAQMENNNVSLIAFSQCLGLSEMLFLLNFSFFVPGRVGFFYPSSTPSIGPKISPLRCCATEYNKYYFAGCM